MIYWKSFSDFIDMGGYGLYVWGSYAVTAVVIAAELIALRARRKGAQAEVKQWLVLHGDRP